MYGSINPWTEWCYWHRDSILKQTLMLMDKSGLRKGKPQKPEQHKGEFHSRERIKMTPEEERENAIQIAYKTGLGYDRYKKEVDALRAQALRDRIENKGIELKEQ